MEWKMHWLSTISFLIGFVIIYLCLRDLNKEAKFAKEFVGPPRPHEWFRTDIGSLARCLECRCGFKAAGDSWKDIYELVDEHDVMLGIVSSPEKLSPRHRVN